MATDIVDRLRQFCICVGDQLYRPMLTLEAAEEIERLREALEAVDSEIVLTGQLKELVDEALSGGYARTTT